MKNEDVGLVADTLLAACERDPSRPFYTESNFRTKLRRAQAKIPILQRLVGGTQDELLRKEYRDVLANARLTDRQNQVLTMRLEGFSFEEIGLVRGHTKQGARNIFVQAIKKVWASFAVYPYTGLSDVYRHEVRRGFRT